MLQHLGVVQGVVAESWSVSAVARGPDRRDARVAPSSIP